MKPTTNNLTAAAYKAAREKIGTQPAVAARSVISREWLGLWRNKPVHKELGR